METVVVATRKVLGPVVMLVFGIFALLLAGYFFWRASTQTLDDLEDFLLLIFTFGVSLLFWWILAAFFFLIASALIITGAIILCTVLSSRTIKVCAAGFVFGKTLIEFSRVWDIQSFGDRIVIVPRYGPGCNITSVKDHAQAVYEMKNYLYAYYYAAA